VEKLRKWLIANKLSLNVAKTEFILIGSKQMIKSISNLQLNVKIENKSIKQVYESKILGLTIDQHLSWTTNTESICKKITSEISALKEFADKQTFLLYIMLLFAHILIAAVKYGMCLEKRNQKDSKNYKTELLGLL
jgi:hypothetical protein